MAKARKKPFKLELTPEDIALDNAISAAAARPVRNIPKAQIQAWIARDEADMTEVQVLGKKVAHAKPKLPRAKKTTE